MVRVVTGEEPLAPLVWRGLLLTIVTLGIYRFWYRTELRRWYWRNTLVAGDGFEYRGTPKELFIGFLIALAVTLPLYFAATLAALFIAGETTANVITGLVVLVVTILAQYGAYRSRRFRMTRTVWRGLRLDQTGSAWRYAGVSVAWALAVAATGGLLLPLFRRSVEAMKIRHTVFGTAEGAFSAPLGGLMLRWVPIWLALAALAGLGAYAFAVGAVLDEGSELQAIAVGSGLLLACGAVLVFFLLWPIYRAAEFRIFTAGSALGPLTFRSDLRARSLYGMYILFGLMMSLLAGVALVLLAGLTFAFGRIIFESGGGVRPPGTAPFIIGGAFLYLCGAYAFMVAKELLLNRPFWRRAAGSITVEGLERLEGVMARPATEENALGEGFADALDFGGV